MSRLPDFSVPRSIDIGSGHGGGWARGHGHPSTPPPPAPSVPLSLAGTAGDTTVSLSWQAPTSGAPITGYRVYQGGVPVASPSGLTATVTGLTNGQAYGFQVSALNATGEGPVTSIVTLTPVAVPTDYWSTQPAFMTRSPSAPQSFSGGSDIEVSNKRFGPTSIYPSSALRFSGVTNIWIHDCDFDQLDWDGIDILDCSGTLTIEHCRMGALLRTGAQGSGRRPDFIQMVRSAMVGHIRNNKIKCGVEHEDIISCVDEAGGVSSGSMLEIDHNAIQGGVNTDGETSTSGTGTMMSDNSTTGGHIWTHHNTYLNTGQVGLAISMGVDNHITDNIVYGAQRTNSNVGIYTPYTGGSPNPGGHEVARNRVWWKNAAGSLNSFFDGGASGTVAGLSPQTNTFDDTTIDSATLAVTL